MKLLETALFCVFAALALPAQAATVTLDLRQAAVADFADGFVDNGDKASTGDFVLTFQNVEVKDQGRGVASRSGINFNSAFTNTTIKVDLIFNIDTIIDMYSMGFTENAENETFQLSGINGTSGLNSFGSQGTSLFDMGTIPVFLAGEAYSLTHTVSGGNQFPLLGGFQLSIAPPAVIPLPAALPLMLLGLGALGILRRRT